MLYKVEKIIVSDERHRHREAYRLEEGPGAKREIEKIRGYNAEDYNLPPLVILSRLNFLSESCPEYIPYRAIFLFGRVPSMDNSLIFVPFHDGGKAKKLFLSAFVGLNNLRGL